MAGEFVISTDPYLDPTNIEVLDDGTHVGQLPHGDSFQLTPDQVEAYRQQVAAYDASVTYREQVATFAVSAAMSRPSQTAI